MKNRPHTRKTNPKIFNIKKIWTLFLFFFHHLNTSFILSSIIKYKDSYFETRLVSLPFLSTSHWSPWRRSSSTPRMSRLWQVIRRHPRRKICFLKGTNSSKCEFLKCALIVSMSRGWRRSEGIFLDLEDFKVGRAVNTVCGSSIWGSSDRLVEVHIYCMNTQHLSAEVSQMSQDLFII